MRATVLSGTNVTLDTNYSEPSPIDNEVVVRVLKAGICETDLQLMLGYMGFQGVLGHEFVGIAESGKFAGQRVVGEINCNCRNCDFCDKELGNHCPNRSVLGILQHDGAFADHISVPEHNLLAVPDSITTDEAVFTEPLAAAFQIPFQLNVERFEKCIVIGDGRLGNLCAQVLKLHGRDVTVIGKHPEKLALLSNLGIATTTRDNAAADRSADLVVDCAGSDTGFTDALAWVKPRGTIVLKTTVAGEQTLALAPIVIDEITVVGSRCGPFADALTALEKRQVEVLPLISKRFDLDDAVAALEHAKSKTALKVILDVNDE